MRIPRELGRMSDHHCKENPTPSKGHYELSQSCGKANQGRQLGGTECVLYSKEETRLRDMNGGSKLQAKVWNAQVCA